MAAEPFFFTWAASSMPPAEGFGHDDPSITPIVTFASIIGHGKAEGSAIVKSSGYDIGVFFDYLFSNLESASLDLEIAIPKNATETFPPRPPLQACPARSFSCSARGHGLVLVASRQRHWRRSPRLYQATARDIRLEVPRVRLYLGKRIRCVPMSGAFALHSDFL